MEWSIGGTPLPDLPFLYGPEYAAMHQKANEIMRNFVASQANPSPTPASGEDSVANGNTQKRALDIWEGG